MKKIKIIIICLLIVVLATSCNTGESELENEIAELENTIEELKTKTALETLEKYKLVDKLMVLEKETVPSLENKISTDKKDYEDQIENLTADVKGADYQRLTFKNDINEILEYISNSSYIPVYEGEVHAFTNEHVKVIKNYFIKSSNDIAKDIPADLLDKLYPIMFPIKITETEVGFTSQYKNAYYYNVVHYETYGMVGHYNYHNNIRAVGAVEDGFRETYIIEIYQENGKWKVGYTGFGG